MNTTASELSVESKRARLAQALRERSSKRRREPVSYAQQRLWFVNQLDPDSPAYNLPVAIIMKGFLDVPAMRRSLDEIVRRHEILRTSFPAPGGELVQEIAPHARIALPVINLSALPDDTRDSIAEILQQTEARRPFNLAKGPLMRAGLLRLGDDHHILLLTLHHIATDGWSLGILIREFTTLYQAFCRRSSSPLPEPRIQYSDFARWQRNWLKGEVLEQQLNYWHNKLAGMPRTELPPDRARRADTGWQSMVLRFSIPPDVSANVREFERREGVTLFMVLAAGFSALLSRYAREEDVGIGILMANRNRVETEDVIGFFTNTVVLRTQPKGELSFREYLRNVQETVLDAQAHQDLPFDRLVDAIEPVRDPVRSPLFQTLFALQNANAERLSIPGIDLQLKTNLAGMAKLDWEVAVYDTEPALTGDVEYCTALYLPETMNRLMRQFCTVLAHVTARPEEMISQIELLTTAEKQELLKTCSGPIVAHPLAQAQDQIAEQAGQTPDAVAVVCGNIYLTYHGLNKQANQLAKCLLAKGACVGAPVAVLLERSVEQIIALVAILKAGGVYLALDQKNPAERLQFMIDECGAAVMVTSTSLAGRLHYSGERIILDDNRWANGLASQDFQRIGDDHDLAYIVYTSGSTGRPKAAMVEHGGMRNHLWAKVRYLNLTASDIVVASAPVSFDVIVWQFLAALLVGGCVRIVSDDAVLSGPELLNCAEQTGVTIIETVPSLLASMLEGELPKLRALRLMISNAEALSEPLARRWWQCYPSIQLLNAYGPSECSDDVSHCVIDCVAETLSTWMPIGFAIDNAELYVCDQFGHPAPWGLPGELYIGGAGVGRGYLNRPELTAEKFVPHPFSAREGARLYRSGDLVRRLHDGRLEFLQRVDQQVKIRGNRVELGEIEVALSEQPGVQQCAVVARRSQSGDQQLVAYIVPQVGSQGSVGAWRDGLQRRLPSYMAPQAFVVLESLPLNSSGKVDRNALPAPNGDAPASSAQYEAPRTLIEEIMAGVWARVLNRDRIGRLDNFFDLGGHSLLATQVISRVREAFHIEIPLRSIFETPTVAGFADYVTQIRKVSDSVPQPAIVPTRRNQDLPLSFAQQRLWFLDQMAPDAAMYNMSYTLRFIGPLSYSALRRSFDRIVERHEALRTTFQAQDGNPVQRISRPAPMALRVIDLADSGVAHTARSIAAEQAARPFDLQYGPLARILLIRVAPLEHLLALTLHHIISDGWSMDVLIRELATLYSAYSGNSATELRELPIAYSDYTVWQREWLQGQALEHLSSYWKRQLADVEPLELRPGHVRRMRKSQAAGIASMAIPKELTAQLIEFSRQNGATAFMALLAAFQILLSRYSGQDDIVVGSVTANRNRKEIEPLIGFFVNMLPLRTRLRWDASFQQLIADVREICLKAYTHQDLPFEKLVDELQPERDPNRNPIVQVTFAVDDEAPEPMTIAGLHVEILPNEFVMTRFDLECYITRNQEQFNVQVLYDRDLFEADWVNRFLANYRTLLGGLMERPKAALASVSLLREEERRQVVEEWNRTEVEYGEGTVVEAMEEQAAQSASSCAVRFGGKELSYQQLHERANRLGHYLRELGVGLEEPVGVCAERSFELVVALLGVLKAGAAYVPLEPGLPQERLRQIARGAGIRRVVGQQWARGWWAEAGLEFVAVDGDWEEIERRPASALPRDVRPENLAYIIYTSGSTGEPKGVAIAHSALWNHMRWMHERFGFDSRERFLQKTSFSFDASVWEFFAPLLAGAELALARPGAQLQPAELLREVEEYGVTVLQVVPTMLQALVEEPGLGWQKSLRKVFSGGEALPEALCRRLTERLEVEVYNLYGPTETTIDSVYDQCQAVEGRMAVAPIGRPVSNLRLYIVDGVGEPVGVGMIGELCVGGAGLARGYYRRPELTAERFVPDPFGRPGERIYLTGDLARYMADGRVEYVGRLDQQIKIRGYRIELGEVEAALGAHPAVQQCVAVARPGVSGGKRLVAYVSLHGGADWDEEGLRRWVQSRLPEYMTPSVMVKMERMPQLASGKVDRKALAEREVSADVEGGYVEPRTEAERALAEIWAQVLGQKRVGVRDNFFSLGGDSILSIQVVARAHQAGLAITARQLFEHQTIEELARAAQGVVCEEERVEAAGEVRLTPIQRWFFEQGFERPWHYNQSVMLASEGGVEAGRLSLALSEVARRHESLRLRFRREGREWEQTYAESGVRTHSFSRIDVNEMGSVRRAVVEAAAGQLQESLDLEEGPLMRVAYFEMGEEGGRLLWILHHLVVDGVSWRILLEDLQQAYEGELRVRRSSSYQRWAERLWEQANSEGVRAEKDYWLRRNYARVKRLKRESDGDNSVASERMVGSELSESDTRALLQEAPRRHGAQIQELLLAALGEALESWSGPGDALVEVEGHGREEDLVGAVDVTRTVGWFTTQYPVLLRGQRGGGVVRRLERVKEDVRGIPRRGLGYGLLRYMSEDEELSRALAAQPAPEVRFNYLGQFDQVLAPEGRFAPAREWTGAPQPREARRTHLIDVTASVSEAKLRLLWRYSDNLHLRHSVEALAGEYIKAIRDLAMSSAQRASAETAFPLAGIDDEQLRAIADQLRRTQ